MMYEFERWMFDDYGYDLATFGSCGLLCAGSIWFFGFLS